MAKHVVAEARAAGKNMVVNSTPSQITSSFNYDPNAENLKPANNNPPAKKTNASNIYPLIKDSNPEVAQKKAQQRAASLNPDKAEAELSRQEGKEAEQTYSKATKKLLEGQTKVENPDSKEASQEEESAELQKVQEEQAREEQEKINLFLAQDAERAEEEEIDAQETKMREIESNLRLAGYKFTREDIEFFMASDFKVNFPVGMTITAGVSFLTSVFFFFTSLVMSVGGSLAGSPLAWLSTLGFSLVVKAVLETTSLGIFVIGYITQTAFSFGEIGVMIYYLKTGSLVARKGNLVRKYLTRLIIIWLIIFFIGWIPGLGLIIYFAGGRGIWRLVKRETRKVEKIIKNGLQ